MFEISNKNHRLGYFNWIPLKSKVLDSKKLQVEEFLEKKKNILTEIRKKIISLFPFSQNSNCRTTFRLRKRKKFVWKNKISW